MHISTERGRGREGYTPAASDVATLAASTSIAEAAASDAVAADTVVADALVADALDAAPASPGAAAAAS